MKANSDTQGTLKKVAVSSFLGNFIEWFDYATYSYFAIVIANVFFPNDDPALALMQTFAVFALSFLLRPIGAIFWGSMGDKKGRKWALSTSIFLMTGATFYGWLAARLPDHRLGGSHHAAVAPHGSGLLGFWRIRRCCNVFGRVRAEGQARRVLLARTGRRRRFCWVGSTFATIMYSVLPTEAVNDWGWRIPFFAGRSAWLDCALHSYQA